MTQRAHPRVQCEPRLAHRDRASQPLMGVAKTGLSVSTLEGGCAPSRLYELQSMPNKSQLNDFAVYESRQPSQLRGSGSDSSSRKDPLPRFRRCAQRLVQPSVGARFCPFPLLLGSMTSGRHLDHVLSRPREDLVILLQRQRAVARRSSQPRPLELPLAANPKRRNTRFLSPYACLPRAQEASSIGTSANPRLSISALICSESRCQLL